jgi:chemotaxis signal transduction protein
MTGDIVSCVIGGEQYALGGGHIREILRVERMRCGSRPGGAAGVVTIGGETVPVYSLASILDQQSGPADASRPAGSQIIVTHGSRGAVGWLVDGVARSRLPADARVTPLPPLVGPPATRWFEGLLEIEERSLLVLSPEHLDPRAPSPPPDRDHRVSASPPTLTTRPPRGGAARLVVMFSSPALPRCGAHRYGLSARRIAAVIPSLPICVVPGSAPRVTGVAAWRGGVMPVMDFRDACDRPAIERERLLVVRSGGALVAFPVEAEMALHQATRDDREADDERDSNPPFVAGTFIVAGSRLALLDLDALLAPVRVAPGSTTDAHTH